MTADEDATLFLDRFCGREEYPVEAAMWSLYRDEFDYEEVSNLCLRVRAGAGTILHEDTQTLNGRPHWEVNLVQTRLEREALVDGAVFEVPEGYDESLDGHLTNFYYCEHEGSERNRIEVLAADGDRLRIRLTGETVDVNFGDGSKPPTRLSVECWFEHNASGRRSIC